MKYLYGIIAAVVLLTGVGFSVYFGIQPKSIPKITYSHFSEPAKMSDAIILRLNQEIKGAPLLLLGVMPGRKMDLEVWKAFLEQSQIPEIQYQALVVDPELPFAAEMFPSAVKIDIRTDLERLIEGAKKAREQGLRMAVIVPSVYASQRLQNNPADRIRKETDLAPMSFSIMGFPRSPEQEANMDIKCVMGSNDRDGVGAMGCMAEQKARLVYRKKSKPGFYEGLMDQVGERDYLVLFNAP
jgi:hypothetical protein